MSVATGVYYIQNVGARTVIDLKDGSTVDGTVTQGWERHMLSDAWTPAQLWVVNQESSNTYTIQNASGRTYMALSKKDNGTPVQCFTHSAAIDHRWVITQVPNNSYYVIQNEERKTYIDLAGGENGAKIQGWEGPDITNKNRLWYFERV